MIDRATIDRIFSTADIVEVVSDYVTLKRKGVNYTACCPFHSEKTPSFIVSPAKGLYKCFGCGKGGNAVSFVMEHEKMSYPEALRTLAKKYNITIEEQAQSDEQRQANDDRESMMVLNSWASDYFIDELRKNDVAYSYFVERGFTDETIQRFNLGYCPEKGDSMATAALKAGFQEEFLEKTGLAGKRERGGHYDRFYSRVMFPIHSLSGRVIGFGGRTLRNDKKVAKYLNSPESEIYHKSNTLYGIFYAKKAITQLDRCILVEGYTDVIQMHQAGIENVVASSGTSLTEEQIKLIKRFSNNVTVIYDGDSAGIKASMRGIDMILKAGLTVRCVRLPDGDDPDSFARGNSTSYLREYISQNEVDFISFKTQLLLDEAQNDPIKRAELITDIIGSIALIPDAIERQVFTRECSRMMDISESILNNEVQRKLIGSVDGKQWYESVRRKENFEEQTHHKPKIADSGTTEITVLEHELVVYLLKYGNETFKLDEDTGENVELSVANTILEELQSLDIEFITPLYKRIIEIYNSSLGNILDINTFVNSEDVEISSFATDVQFLDDKYTESQIWGKADKVLYTEKERLGEAIPKALSILLQKVINNRILTKIGELSSIDGDDEKSGDIIRDISTLNEIRTQICEKFERTV